MFKYFEEITRLIKKNADVGICEDIISHVFQESGFSRKDQDQSPSDLARIVAQVGMGTDFKIPEKGYVTLDEPACGSGSLILAFAEAMTAKELSYSEQLVVRATDTDPKCVHMAYIQLSLYGIPAVVIHGETLSLKEYHRWYTPMYILGDWVWRHPFSLNRGKSADDELLKRITKPLYGAIREIQNKYNI